LDRLIRHSPASTEIAIASQRKNRTQLTWRLCYASFEANIN
jgi:hypothetical protein